MQNKEFIPALIHTRLNWAALPIGLVLLTHLTAWLKGHLYHPLTLQSMSGLFEVLKTLSASLGGFFVSHLRAWRLIENN